MKYLMTIMLIALSINAFSIDKYVVCMEQKLLFDVLRKEIEPRLTRLTRCVNDYMELGYVPLSGLHGTTGGVSNEGASFTFFQSLVWKGKIK